MSSSIAIAPRSQWGFTGWSSAPYSAPLSVRSEFFVHYEGGTSCIAQTGPSVPRSIHAFHKTKWAGIGYNYVIDANGVIYEGRGAYLVGAHCPNHNRSGFGVQLHLGGNDTPTPAMLQSTVALRNYLESLTGRTLARKGHRDGYSTSCPGDKLWNWVHSGMAISGSIGGAAVPVLSATNGNPPATAGLTLRTEKVARAIQQTCRNYGASDLDGTQITVDGSFGPRTAAGFQRVLNHKAAKLQWRTRIAVDGDFGPASLALFGSTLGYPKASEVQACTAFMARISDGGF